VRATTALLLQETFTLKCFTTDGKKLLPKKSITVRPTKQHIEQLGKPVPYNPIKKPTAGIHCDPGLS